MVNRHLEPSALYCNVMLLLMLGACLKASCMLVSQLCLSFHNSVRCVNPDHSPCMLSANWRECQIVSVPSGIISSSGTTA